MLLADPDATTTPVSTRESTASLLRALLVLAMPVLIEQVLHGFAGLADTWIANHFIRITPQMSAVEVEAARRAMTAAGSAAGTISYLLWFVGLVAGAVGTGSTAIIARATGARDRRLANSICGQSIGLALAVGLVLAFVVFALAGPIARITGLPDEAVGFARTYIQIISFGLPFMIVLMVANACLRGAGDTIWPAIAMIVVDVVNIALAFTLAFGWLGLPALGFTGIAVGALCGYVVGGTLQVILLLVGRGRVRLYLHRLRPHWHNMRRLLRIGLPSGVESSIMWIVNFVLIQVINRLDATAAFGAAHGIAVRIEAFSFLAGFAMAIAATTMVGQSLGMRDPRRAQRSAMLAYALGGSMMTFAGVLYILFGRHFAAAMSDDPRVVELTTECLLYTGFIQCFFAAAMIFGGSLRGAGDTLTVMVINLIFLLGVRLLGLLAMVQWSRPDLGDIWLLLSGEIALRGTALFVQFQRGRWKRVKV
ncbi:MAG: MATE family efflux transporter [Phycisphaerae bacterium]|nr:MATE family efflux transporter [Phycisphaerae bacterium]MDW8263285.1 MATE family efflux transporter [Phycisphaerales bacterium]